MHEAVAGEQNEVSSCSNEVVFVISALLARNTLITQSNLQLQTLQLLIAAKANLDVQDHNGNTPLMLSMVCRSSLLATSCAPFFLGSFIT